MRVISTNKGKPVEINYHGKIVKTGIYKYPVNGEIYLGTTDVRGDSVVDRRYHGGLDKACYLYSERHYEFWKNKYPNLDWAYGMFGENLTISDLNEGDVYIGDIYKTGTCLVQVSQPRQPCYKLNYRFNCDNMVKEFIKAGFPGAYVRVLEEGVVKKGDDVLLMKRNPASLSLREVYQMLYNIENDPALLRRAFDDPALADSCKKDLMK